MSSVFISAIDMFFQVIYLFILIRIILSWFPISRNNGIVAMIYSLTEPILGPIRHMIDKSPIGGGMMLDFSPVIALFVMNIVKSLLISAVYSVF